MPTPAAVLLIDVSGTAFGGAPTWTDSTHDLMWVDGISITRGAQDERSDPPAATCTFRLSNADGRWTPGNAAAPAGWDVGARVRVGVGDDASGYVDLYADTYAGDAAVDRFDGYVDSIEPTWVGGVHTWNVVSVSCTDITARLARSQPLKSLVVQEMLADSPTYLYPLDEEAGSVSAGDISGNGCRAARRIDGKYGAADLTFGGDLGLPDAASGATFSSDDTPGAQPGKLSVLAISHNDGGPVIPSGGYTVACWAVIPETPPSGSTTEVLLNFNGGPNSSGHTNAGRMFFNYDGSASYSIFDGVYTAAAGFGTGALRPGTHYLVASVGTDRRTVKMYVDGVLVDTAVAGGAVNLAFARNHIGGNLSITVSQVGQQFQGTIGLVALYPSVLSAARILEHYQAGTGQLIESSDARFARLAGYANAPVGTLPAGVALMGHQNTNGVTVTDALTLVAHTEGTVAYATRSGQLTFDSRWHRYDATAGLTLTVDDIDPPTVRRDRQGLANEATVTRQGGAAQRVVDTAAQAADGRFDGGSLEVACSTDDDALQAAHWRVATSNAPLTRIPSLKVNLMRAGTALASQVLAADISTLTHLTGLPPQAPASSLDLFVEGGSEVISASAWSVEFFTSPNLPPVGKVIASGTDPYAAVDGTNRVGF